jgi:hypothetical protein
MLPFYRSKYIPLPDLSPGGKNALKNKTAPQNIDQPMNERFIFTAELL